MSAQAVTKIQADQIAGLRELISEVIAEEGRKLFHVDFLTDVERIKRSPVGAVIRMEEDIRRLREGQEALRAEMREGQEALRQELKREISRLEQVMDARFQAVDARLQALEGRFDQFEKRLARTDFWIKFFAGLVTALFAAQLVQTFIR